jgi:hypothetical protein
MHAVASRIAGFLQKVRGIIPQARAQVFARSLTAGETDPNNAITNEALFR